MRTDARVFIRLQLPEKSLLFNSGLPNPELKSKFGFGPKNGSRVKGGADVLRGRTCPIKPSEIKNLATSDSCRNYDDDA